MRDDAGIQRAASAALAADALLRGASIRVLISRGAAYLTGTINRFAHCEAARKLVAAIPGVRSVHCDLVVRLPAENVREDNHIERAAQRALDCNPKVPGNVQAQVKDAWIRLTGLAATPLQREAAEEAVRHVAGVLGVTNAICLAPAVAPFVLRDNIELALGRHPAREVRHLEIVIDGTVVTVRGRIDSSAERDVVLGAARSTPGVTEVRDELQLGRPRQASTLDGQFS